MKNNLIILGLILIFQVSCAQKEEILTKGNIDFFIGKEVVNANEENEEQIIQLWKDYLTEGKFQDSNSPYWSFDQLKIPDEYLWAVGVESLQERDYRVQCKIIGIFPAENDFYALKTAFTHVDNKGEIHLDTITSVYAKKIMGKFLLISSAEYQKSVLKHHKVGSINYYVHPSHEFNVSDAEKMNEFNQFIAKEFSVQPMEFDYFVANSARDIVDIWGYEYLDRMYIPNQTGGVASIHNKIIYAGNNSEYYPHELVHLYTYDSVPKDYHFWIGEGIATYYGGSGGYSLEWHLKRLAEFLEENPDFDMTDLDILNKEIPNGEYKTDFRYVIGGFFMKKIHQKYGVEGFLDALQVTGGNENYFLFLKEKLGIEKAEFNYYIKQGLKN